MDPIKSKRVPRFVEEYCKDRNGTQAAIRAGYTKNPNSAGVTAHVLLSDPKIQALVQAEMARVSRDVHVQVGDVLVEWLALATADPSKIAHTRRLNCRYCYGAGHEYQWSEREYAEACDKALAASEGKGVTTPLPECVGGFGWRFNAEPNPLCPECHGEGKEDIFICDTESLTGPERKLIAGMKMGRNGVEIKFRDQDAAVQNLAKYLGMLIERKEVTGKDGQPLLPVEAIDASKISTEALRELLGARRDTKPE